MYSVYRFRHIFSWLPVVLAAGWVLMNQHAPLSIKPRYDESTMELALVDPTPPVEAQPEAQPEPLPEPEPEPKATAPSPEPVMAPKPKPAPKPKAVAKPKPVTRPASRSVAEPVRRQPAVAPATATPKPVAPRVNSAAIENGWIAGLRSDLEAQKRYPTGRQASLERPEGSVEIWLEVDRSGRVLASGITNKARSMLLNRAALGSLQNIRQVKPFPTDAFTGQNSRRFTATLNYRAP